MILYSRFIGAIAGHESFHLQEARRGQLDLVAHQHRRWRRDELLPR